MSQVNHGKSDVMFRQEVIVPTIISDQQSSELVYPCKRALTYEATLVHLSTEQSPASSFGTLSVSFVLCHVGYQVMIETHLSCLPGIEGAVSIKVSPLNVQTRSFH
jgi:hypothetical protein